MAKNKEQLNVLIPTALKNRLTSLKRANNIPVSTITATALRIYLDKAEKDGYVEFKASPPKKHS